MPTSVRITRHPGDGRRYTVGQTVTLPDPVAAKLVATGCAELAGRSATASFCAMVDTFRKAGPPSPPKPATPPPPKVSVRLKAAGPVAGRLRNAGDQVAVSESRAAMLVAQGLADIPAGVSPRFGEKVASYRAFAELESKRTGGIQLSTLLS